MAGDNAELNDTLQGFYRDRDVGKATRGLRQHLEGEDLGEPLTFYAFARIAELVPEAREAFARLRDQQPAYLDRVLQGVRGVVDPYAEITGATELDLLWVEFFVTGELTPLRRIVGVLDGEDLVRKRLSAWLRTESASFFGRRRIAKLKPLFIRCVMPIDYEAATIEDGVDMDVHVALAARKGNLKFAELPIELTQADCVRLAVKSAALWSLHANAKHHERVAEFCAAEATRPGGAARLVLPGAR